MRRKKTYIDADGVKRGYYVYVHKDRTTGEVFYVGKGSGKRAWATAARNTKWKERVALLVDGWDVEIVTDDLSELEAFDIERTLVKQYGGCQTEGGSLVNLVPGGETGLCAELAFHLDDREWSQVYSDARVFKSFSRAKEEEIVQGLETALRSLLSEIDRLGKEADESADDALRGNVDDLDFFAGSISDHISDFRRRRLSWKDLALAVEELAHDIEYDQERTTKRCRNVEAIQERLLAMVGSFLKQIDSGNRKEAEDIADQAARRLA
ncbi:MAG: hypothetical protein JW741_23910 [Sedimentisphaerales bacterium]|nr:hypothetical protein [Sedimentisphaerales bacterium]